MIKGDITNLSGSKIRPALVLLSSDIDVTIAFITTQFNWIDESCVAIEASIENGLKKNSLIRLNKLASVDNNLVLGKIGRLQLKDILQINVQLKKILKIS